MSVMNQTRNWTYCESSMLTIIMSMLQTKELVSNCRRVNWHWNRISCLSSAWIFSSITVPPDIADADLYNQILQREQGLRQLNLERTLDYSISHLTYLTWLSLRGTCITDQYVLQLCRLIHLTHFDINDCHNLTPACLAVLENFSRLTWLAVPAHIVDDTGMQWIANRHVTLNHFETNRGPTTVNGADVGWKLSASGFKQFSRLTNLTEWNFSHVALQATDERLSFFSHIRMKKLNLMGCTRMLPTTIQKFGLCSSLEKLVIIGDVQLSGTSFDNCYWPNLIDLDILRFHKMFQSIAHACPNLLILTLGPPTFADLQSMTTLDYLDFQHLSRLSKLAQLNIGAFEYFDGRCLSVLSCIPTLESLNISFCDSISDDDLVWLCPSYLPRLTNLDISHCMITSKGLRTLMQLIQLTDLDLCGIHEVSHDYVQELFDKMPNMENLVVCYHCKNYQLLRNQVKIQVVPLVPGMHRSGRKVIINGCYKK